MDEEDLERMEIEDQAATVGKLTPREYAKIRNMQPQLVYYHLRNNHIELELCICGRKVIDVKKTDDFFDDLRGDKKEMTIKHDD
jgi:hypothetical protein